MLNHLTSVPSGLEITSSIPVPYLLGGICSLAKKGMIYVDFPAPEAMTNDPELFL